MDAMDRLKSLFRRSDEPSATCRLDGRSKELLAASIKMMPYEERGWITIKEAAILFSPEDDEYAFREKDGGTRNLASFVAEETRRCSFAFVDVAERVLQRQEEQHRPRHPRVPRARAKSDGILPA